MEDLTPDPAYIVGRWFRTWDQAGRRRASRVAHLIVRTIPDYLISACAGEASEPILAWFGDEVADPPKKCKRCLAASSQPDIVESQSAT